MNLCNSELLYKVKVKVLGKVLIKSRSEAGSVVDMRILILGSHGYIGRHLVEILEKSENSFIRIARTSDIRVSSGAIQEFKPTHAINLASSKLWATPEESIDGNFNFPSQILKNCIASGEQFTKWIQIGSYFELQVELGRLDSYSKDKSAFRRHLEAISKDGNFSITSLILPHVVGYKENEKRLNSILIEALLQKKPIDLTSGEQFLPILHLDDACQAILSSILTNQSFCSAKPVWYGRVNEYILSLIDEDNHHLLKFKPEVESVDANFPKLVFPPQVMNFAPIKTFEMIIQEFRTYYQV